jgi:tape measure domain-containing protein
MVNSVQYQISLRDMLSSTLNNANRNVNNFDANVDEATQSVMKLNAAMSATGSTANSFMQTTGAMALGTMLSRGIEVAGKAALDQVKSVISAGLDASKLRSEFATLAGDKSIGNMLFGDLNKYISDSIFGTELFGGARTLMGFGIAVEDILPTLKQLGDVSMGDKEKMQGLIIALGQVSANGKLMSQEVNQMINAGFNPLQEISRTTGKSVEVLRDEMQRGALSAQVLKDAFKSVTSQGGMFFGMLDSVSETPLGKLRAMEGNIDMAKQQLGEALLPALSDFMDASKPLIEALPAMFRALQPTIEDAIQGFTTLAKWLGENSDKVGGLVKVVKLAIEGYILWKGISTALSIANWALARSTAASTAATIANTTAIAAENTALVVEAELVAALAIEYEALGASQLAYAGTSAAVVAGLEAQALAAASLPVGVAAASGAGVAAGVAGLAAGVATVAIPVFIAGMAVSVAAKMLGPNDMSWKDMFTPREYGIEYSDSPYFQRLRSEMNAERASKQLREKPVQSESLNPNQSWGYMAGINGISPWMLEKYGIKKKDNKSTTTDPLKADIAKVTGQQVRNTYVTINGGLVHEFNVKTQTLKESAPEIKRLVTQVLTDAINDSQITD